MANFIGDTAAAATKSEKVVSFVQASLRQSAQMLPTITDYSSLVQPGDDSVSIPKKSNEFTVNKLDNPQDNDANCPEPQVVTYSKDQILFDCKAHVSWHIPMLTEAMTSINLMAEAVSDATWAHGDDIDKMIWQKLFDGAAAANNVVDASDIYTNIVCAEQKLREANVPYTMGDIFYSVTPAGKKALQTSSTVRIIDASVYGNSMPLVNGEFGMLGGARLVVTNNAVDATGAADINGQMMWHRRAMGFALSVSPIFRQVDDVDCMVTKYGLAQQYGLKAMCDGKYIAKVTAV